MSIVTKIALPTPADAEAAIRQLAADLTFAYRAKGHTKPVVEFWIGRPGVVAYVHDQVVGEGMSSATGADLAEAARKVRAMIDALPDLRAYDADFSGPLVLQSEIAA
jgi:hypothetical protein